MKSNLYGQLQTRIELRKMDRLVFRSMCVIAILVMCGFGFLMAANLSVILS